MSLSLSLSLSDFCDPLSLSWRSQTPILMLMNPNFDPTKRAIQTALKLFLRPIRQATLPSKLLKGLLFIMFLTGFALLSTDIHMASTTNLCTMYLRKLLHSICFSDNTQAGIWSPMAPLLKFATFFFTSLPLCKKLVPFLAPQQFHRHRPSLNSRQLRRKHTINFCVERPIRKTTNFSMSINWIKTCNCYSNSKPSVSIPTKSTFNLPLTWTQRHTSHFSLDMLVFVLCHPRSL